MCRFSKHTPDFFLIFPSNRFREIPHGTLLDIFDRISWNLQDMDFYSRRFLLQRHKVYERFFLDFLNQPFRSSQNGFRTQFELSAVTTLFLNILQSTLIFLESALYGLSFCGWIVSIFPKWVQHLIRIMACNFLVYENFTVDPYNFGISSSRTIFWWLNDFRKLLSIPTTYKKALSTFRIVILLAILSNATGFSANVIET